MGIAGAARARALDGGARWGSRAQAEGALFCYDIDKMLPNQNVNKWQFKHIDAYFRRRTRIIREKTVLNIELNVIVD